MSNRQLLLGWVDAESGGSCACPGRGLPFTRLHELHHLRLCAACCSKSGFLSKECTDDGVDLRVVLSRWGVFGASGLCLLGLTKLAVSGPGLTGVIKKLWD